MGSPVRSVSVSASKSPPPMHTASENLVRKYQVKETQLSVRSSTIVGERVVSFLRSIHPVKTTESVAAETGISSSTVAKWLERSSVPGGLAILRLAAAYGPEFLVAVYPKAPAWLRDSHRRYRIEQIERQQEALERELEGLQ